MLLRDLTMLTTMNNYLFCLYSPLHFTVLPSLYYCTLPYLLESCETDKGKIISPIYSGFDIFKVKDKNED